MSLTSRIARGASAVFGAELVRLGAQAAIVVLLTRVFLDPDEYGLLFLAIAVFSIATLLGTVGIPKSTAKFLAEYGERDETQIRHVLRVSMVANAVVLAVVCLVFVAVADWIADVYGEPRLVPLLVLGAAYIVCKVAHGYLLICFQGLGRVELTAGTKTVSSVGHLAVITLLLALGFGVVGALTGYIVGYALGAVFGGYFLYRTAGAYPRARAMESGLARRLLEYSVPLTASQAGNVLYKRVDTLMVGFFLTPAAVGFYELAKQVSSFVVAPADSLGFTVAPTFGEHKSAAKLDRAARVYEQSLEYILLVYLPAVVGVVLLAEPGIRLVFGEAYLGAVPVLQVFAAFVLFQAIDKITNDSLDYLGRATERAIGKGVTGTLNVGLNLVLIPTVGVVGAAISTALCYGLMVTYNVYLIDQELDLGRHRLARSLAVTAAVTATMGVVVFTFAPVIDGLLSLFAVIGAGVLVWGVVAVASGLVDPRTVAASI